MTRSGSASRAGSACTAAWSTSWPGIRVWTRTRPPPSRVPTSRAARASRARVSSPAPNRGASRCWSMSRKATAVGPGHPVEGRLGAHHQTGPASPVAVRRLRGAGDLPGLHAGQGRQLLGGPGHPDAEDLEPGGVALGAHHRPVLVAPPAPEPVARLVLGHGPAAPGAAGQGPAVGAGQQPGPPGPVEDAHHPTVRSVEDRVQEAGQSLGEQSGPGIVAGAVDHLDHRPAPTLHRSGGGHQRPTLGQGHRRART